MHPTTLVARRVWWGLLLSLLWPAALTGTASAQEKLPPPQEALDTSVLQVPINTTKRVEMSNKEIIREVRNENPKVVRVQSIVDDPRAVLVTGLSVGTSRLTFVDQNKKVEQLDIKVPDQSGVDLEQKRARILELVKLTVPTAVIDVTMTGPFSGVITGTAPSSDAVQTILETARGAIGAQALIYNAMKVGGVQQVQLEVVVALVNRSHLRQMSANWILHGNRFFVSDVVGTATGAPLTTAANFISTAGANGGVGGGVTSNLAQTPTLNFGIIGNTVSFQQFLEALRTQGMSKVLAEPRVVTLSGRPANVVSGGQTPILTSSGLGGPSVQYKDFGTFVNFLPIVLGDGKIHLEVYAELSQIDQGAGISVPSANGNTVVPGFASRRAQVAVQMEDGQTVAIGGLVQNRVTASVQKVPVVGDLPYLGVLFSTKSYQEQEEELLILVTPRLFDPLCCTQIPKYLPGRETRSPDDFELFLEGILEAPRGPRYVTYNPLHYQGAHMNSPTAGQFPCYGSGYLGTGGCANGQCATPAALQAAPLQAGQGTVRPGSATGMPRTVLPNPPPIPSPVDVDNRATLPAPGGTE